MTTESPHQADVNIEPTGEKLYIRIRGLAETPSGLDSLCCLLTDPKTVKSIYPIELIGSDVLILMPESGLAEQSKCLRIVVDWCEQNGLTSFFIKKALGASALPTDALTVQDARLSRVARRRVFLEFDTNPDEETDEELPGEFDPKAVPKSLERQVGGWVEALRRRINEPIVF